jgi:hypothetical protein
MDRCALFVDAGYLLADGAMAVHGTRHRDAVSWDFGGLLQLLGNLARERTGLPLLRCYWYEATVEGRRSLEHEALADLPGLKLRLGRIRPGRREGVDSEIHRDLMTLARNGAVADAVLVSGDEDLAQVVTDAQDLGVRVTVLHVAADGNWTISRALRQECDDLIEVGAAQLRPYVSLLAGIEAPASTTAGALPPGPSPSSSSSSQGYDQGAASPVSPLSNGHGSSAGSLGPMQTTGPLNSPPPASPLSGPPSGVAPTSTADFASPAGSGYGSSGGRDPSSTGYESPGYESSRYDSGSSSSGSGYGSSSPSSPSGAGSGYGTSGSGGSSPGGSEYGSGSEYSSSSGSDYGSGSEYGSRYGSGSGSGYGSGSSGGGSGYNSLTDPGLSSGSAPRLPPGSTPPLGSSSMSNGSTAPGQGHNTGPQSPGSHSTGPPTAGAHRTGPHHTGSPSPPSPLAPPQSEPSPLHAAPTPTASAPPQRSGPQYPPSSSPLSPPPLSPPPSPPSSQSRGPYTGPQQLAPVPAQQASPSLADAVKAAHHEGQDFGESVARDAPALWLEAVLARKPRMPSDLEARLLQGSSLPIDFLLHDEVRHALRRGFWDALERSRR